MKKNEREAQALEIYQFWIETMCKRPQTKPLAKRLRMIQDRLRDGFSVDYIKECIVNCSLSPFHMGGNIHQIIHNDLTLICRSDKIENFFDNVGQQNLNLGIPTKLEQSFRNIDNFRPPLQQENDNDPTKTEH